MYQGWNAPRSIGRLL